MTTVAVSQILNEIIIGFETGKNEIIGKALISTGFPALDEFISGFQKLSLTVIAGRPGMGKSAMSLSMAYKIASRGTAVGYISSERTPQEILLQLAASKSAFPLHSIPSELVRNKELQSLRAMSDRLNIPLFLSGGKAMNIDEVLDDCKQHLKQDVEIIFIDCLQLLSYNGKIDSLEFDKGEPNHHAFNITKPLFDFAFENNVALVTTSQISSAVETRGGMKRPQIADVKWSQYLEDLADTVLLIYRPEYYGITQDEEGNSTERVVELIVAKNRYGPRGVCYTRFDSGTGWFSS